MPEGIEGVANATSNAIESATEAAGQSAADVVETGANEFVQDLAQSIENIDAERGPQAALENLAGGMSTESPEITPSEEPTMQAPENPESAQEVIEQPIEEQAQSNIDTP